MAQFGGRVVLVTGASSGIGREACLMYAERGARVVAVARRLPLLRSLRREVEGGGGHLDYVQCDVADRKRVEWAASDVLDRMGCPDILVNNAGIIRVGPVMRMGTDAIHDIMETNYFGMVHMTKAFLPHMIKRGSGHIVNVASLAASFGLPGIAAYCASKSAMLGFSEGLRHELAGSGIGVTVVSPIMVRTEFADIRGYALEPRRVAGAILRASGSPRAEITVPAAARAAVLAKHGVPYLTDYVISRAFSKAVRDAIEQG